MSNQIDSQQPPQGQGPHHRRRRKHVPHHLRSNDYVIRRNNRERMRVQSVNAAFETLRQHVPYVYQNHDNKTSKVSILRQAAGYIFSLTSLLGGAEGPGTCRTRSAHPSDVWTAKACLHVQSSCHRQQESTSGRPVQLTIRQGEIILANVGEVPVQSLWVAGSSSLPLAGFGADYNEIRMPSRLEISQTRLKKHPPSQFLDRNASGYYCGNVANGLVNVGTDVRTSEKARPITPWISESKSCIQQMSSGHDTLSTAVAQQYFGSSCVSYSSFASLPLDHIWTH